MNFIATGLMTYFHVVSALSVVGLSAKTGDRADLFLYTLKDEECVLEEGKYSFQNTVISIHCDRYRGGSVLFLSLKFAYFILCYLAWFIYRPRKRTYLIHHTYFQPTILAHVDWKDVFFTYVVSIEEGVGTYGGFKHHVQTKYTEGKKLAGVKYVVRKLLSIFVDERFSVLKDSNSHNNSLFIKSLEEVSKWKRFDFTEINNKQQNNILFVSSMLVDAGYLSSKEYEDLILKLIKEYKNYNIYVKPHPNEKISLDIYKRLNLYVLDKSLPGEAVLDQIGLDFIIGFRSGLLLTAHNVYGIDYFYFDEADFLGSSKLTIDSGINDLFLKDRKVKFNRDE